MTPTGSIHPNVADPRPGKTRQSAPDVGAHRLGQDEQYLTVREILSEVSTPVDDSLSRERSDFCRFGYATLGCGPDWHLIVVGRWLYSSWNSAVGNLVVGTIVAN